MLETNTAVSAQETAPRGWAMAQTYQILDKNVHLRTTEAQFGAQLRRMMRSFPLLPASAPVDVNFSFLRPHMADDEKERLYHFFFHNDDFIERSRFHWRLFRLLEWRLRVFLVRSSSLYHLVHAGSVAKDGVGILIPGRSRDGKSFLTLALLLEGYKYYSDELSLVDSEKAQIIPFPKPLSLRELTFFPQLDPADSRWLGPVMDEDDPSTTQQKKPLWFIHPLDIRADAIGHPVGVQLILFPRTNVSAVPTARLLSPGEAMREMVDRSFNCSDDGFQLMARLVQTVPSYELASGDLHVSTAVVDRLVAEHQIASQEST